MPPKPHSYTAAGDPVTDTPSERDLRPSKSHFKRESTDLQVLGRRLSELADAHRLKLGLPDKLENAIADYRSFTKNEARRRQLQYIGKVMRQVDEDEVARLRAALESAAGQSREETALLHAAERWRDKLLADLGAAQAFADTFPQADMTHIRTLVRTAQKEHAAKKPPRAYRELFQAIRSLQQEASREANEAMNSALESAADPADGAV
jgi:ribosome-associated protein